LVGPRPRRPWKLTALSAVHASIEGGTATGLDDGTLGSPRLRSFV